MGFDKGLRKAFNTPVEINITRKTLISILLILLVGAGAFFFFKKNPNQDKPQLNSNPNETTENTPEVTDTENDESDPTANWVTYENILDGVTLKLPLETNKPLWDNTGHYSKGTLLPGNTRLTLSLRGQNQPLPDQYESFGNTLVTEGFQTRKVDLKDKIAVSFEGTTSADSLATMSANCSGVTVGVSVKINSDNYLVVSHTACEDFNVLNPEQNRLDFESDERIFSLILTTLRFEE